MNKKNILKKTAAVVLGTAITVGATGCNFLITDNEKDLDQVIAKVNISESLKKEEGYETVANDLDKVIKDYNLSSNIYKRDLIANFLSTGYSYVQNGYTYKDTFTMLLDNLIDRTIMIQYAVAYYLKNDSNLTVAGCKNYYDAAVNAADDKTKTLYENYPEVLAYKYFLTENDTDMEEFDRVEYQLKYSFNASLDSLEASYITEEEEEHDHGDTRTLPTNAGTEKSDYYTKNYEIYTGRKTVSEDNEYEPLDGSTKTTRQKAYNAFLANLQSYSLVKTKGEAAEDTSDFTSLEYYYLELSSSLGQALISKYYEELEEVATDALTEEYVTSEYEKMYNDQMLSYKSDISAFETAMDSVSSTSFLLYGLENYGYVYNILLPFSTSQEVAYKEAQNRGLSSEELYAVRRNILENVKGEDQRSSWISNHDHADYSYEKDGKYFFFDGNLNETDKYEKLSQYAGTYAFNGTVSEDKEEIKANSVSIDEFIAIFEEHINGVSGLTVSGDKVSTYYDDAARPFKNAEKNEINYDKFVYYTGKVEFAETPVAKDFFNPETQAYKALSAVNELMFAYSTDTGCLNTYMGYSVSPYGTNFVKEFEYAAQEAIKGGVGSYAVCATDYGWHIIYVSFKYETTGKVYGEYNHADAVGDDKVEGSFSNLFYEYLESNLAKTHASETESVVLNKYDNSASVTRYQSRYKDLLEMDN